jgi:glycosyltransferase involved in cell wall biosynthesis
LRVAIVIPAYDEQASIGDVISSIAEFGDVIVVSDGSTDGTTEVSRQAGATVIEHESNQGYGAALATGFYHANQADYEVVVSFDADGELEAEAIGRAIVEIERGTAEIVLGWRTRVPRFSERLFGYYTRYRFGVPDILCGLKAFAMAVYRKHRTEMGSSNVFTGLALAALRAKTKFAIIPITVKPRTDVSRFGNGWRANQRILGALFRAVRMDLMERRK